MKHIHFQLMIFNPENLHKCKSSIQGILVIYLSEILMTYQGNREKILNMLIKFKLSKPFKQNEWVSNNNNNNNRSLLLLMRMIIWMSKDSCLKKNKRKLITLNKKIQRSNILWFKKKKLYLTDWIRIINIKEFLKSNEYIFENYLKIMIYFLKLNSVKKIIFIDIIIWLKVDNH